jgi:hypothetical protein
MHFANWKKIKIIRGVGHGFGPAYKVIRLDYLSQQAHAQWKLEYYPGKIVKAPDHSLGVALYRDWSVARAMTPLNARLLKVEPLTQPIEQKNELLFPDNYSDMCFLWALGRAGKTDLVEKILNQHNILYGRPAAGTIYCALVYVKEEIQ